MKRAHLAVVAAIVLSLVPISQVTLVAGEEVVGRPELTVYAPNGEFAPGQEVTLEVYVTNEGRIRQAGPNEYVERVTTARSTTLELSDGSTPLEVDTGVYPVGSVSTGRSGPFEFRLTIPRDVEPGSYRLPVAVAYDYTILVDYGNGEPEFQDGFERERQYVTVQVRDSPQFEIVDTSTDALVGGEGNFTVTMKNTGTRSASASNVVVRSASDELTFGSGSTSSESFVGEWAPGETRRMHYSAALSDDAVARNYTIRTTVDYTDTDGIEQTSRVLTATLRPGGEQSFALAGVESDLRVGSEGRLEGTVVNRGPKAASDPVVRLTVNGTAIDVTDGEYALPDLAPGQQVDFGFDVDVSDAASTGRKQFSLRVTYRDAEGDIRRSETMRTRAELAPFREDFTIEPVAATVEAGESARVRLQVTNERDVTLRDINAKAFLDDPLDSDDDEAYVTALAPGESTEIVLTVRAASGATAKPYPVSIDFQYDEPDGDTQLSESYDVPVQVTSSDRRGGGPPVPVVVGLGVLALLVAGGVYWYRR